MIVGQGIRRRREERGWSQSKLGVLSGTGPSGTSQIETGRRNPSAGTLQRIADALEVEVRDLFPLEQAPLPDFEDKRPTTEPLSPKLRRYAAWARRAELERTLQHLTLRLETLRDQAKMHYEADDPEKLWPVFMDSMLLAGGAEALLVESREGAEKLGGETEEERRLRGRLEHRTQDLEEEREKLGDMWTEVSHAKADAEKEALLKVLHPERNHPTSTISAPSGNGGRSRLG